MSRAEAISTRSWQHRDWRRLAPPLLAIAYPWCLDLFHQAATSSMGGRLAIASLALFAAFALPVFALVSTTRRDGAAGTTPFDLRTRRAAFLVVGAPTLYVFLGVVLYLLRVKVSDEWPWALFWLAIAAWAGAASDATIVATPGPPPARRRVLHGVVALVLLVYVAFHLTNHLVGLFGADAHAAFMAVGRVVYRSPVGEPVLVGLMLLQVATGLRLAWYWSARPAGGWRAFQVASGLYLALFIVGHMNSVFIYARTDLKIMTDWAFATGAPSGLLRDAWNIRLLPHYGLGVFFVLGHLASGLRVVLLAHGRLSPTVDRAAIVGLGLSAVVATAIVCALCGLRLTVA